VIKVLVCLARSRATVSGLPFGEEYLFSTTLTIGTLTYLFGYVVDIMTSE
jgi:hypothetical protein